MEYLIQDTTLTGIADAIRAKTGGTDPIPVTDMAAQIAAITGGPEETLTTIFEEQTVEGFVGDTETGFAHAMIDTTSALVVGESYKVLWDGTEVTLVAIDTDGFPCLNNEVGGFAVMYLSPEIMAEVMGTESGAFQFISMDTEATSHTIGIYQVAGDGAGDGSAESIVYVTFMNGDVELCKTACMVGDCSIDPVECAKIAVPTKEPTVDTVYAYAGGWALTEGGEADEMALIDVTEDRVVYAPYTESVREYTVNFYDGETLLESLQVPYGQVPSPTEPEKDGSYFDGWSPELSAVTGDADYQVVWTESNVLYSGTCGDAVFWELSKDGVLTCFGAGDMLVTSASANVPWNLYRSQITSAVIRSGVTSIMYYAFFDCTNLTSVEIADSVTMFGDGAFQGCTGLTSVTLPSGLTTVGYGAFQGCTGLTSVTLPSGVTEIKNYAFKECTGLTSVTLPSGLTSIALTLFYGCGKLQSIEIPATVSSIGKNAFYNCYALKSAVFQDTATWYVGYSAGAQTTAIAEPDLADASTAATYLRSTYASRYWTKV